MFAKLNLLLYVINDTNTSRYDSAILCVVSILMEIMLILPRHVTYLT